MPTVRIPTALRTYTQNRDEVRVSGGTVGEALKDLETQCPGIAARLFDERGSVRRYVNIFHNDEDIRFLDALNTRVSEADRITLIPAIAGGAC